MRRYSPGYYSPPRREYGSRGRSPPRGGYSPSRRGYSPPRRSYGGGYGRRKEQSSGSLLVRNIPLDCRPEELRVPFERFGVVRDVYIPKDYYSGEPRGFAFVQFVDSYDASQAQYHMNKQIFAGREISVVLAAETRKRPEEMRRKTRQRGPPRYGGQRSPYYRHSRSRSVSRSRSPQIRSGSRAVYRSRSYTPSPRRRSDADRRRPSKDSPRERVGRRSYSPAYDDVADGRDAVNGYERKSKNSSKDARRNRESSPRSPSRSRSPPPDALPARSG
ncbi:hypothetical protein Dimus_033897 [Dionaea muscipula]